MPMPVLGSIFHGTVYFVAVALFLGGGKTFLIEVIKFILIITQSSNNSQQIFSSFVIELKIGGDWLKL